MKLLLSGIAFFATLVAADRLLTISEQEDCARLERQVDQGYIQAIPAWCAEVPR